MKHNFNACNIPTNQSKAYQNTTKVYQFDKTPFGLLLKTFLRPSWLKSSLVVVFVSPALPQACCQGAKGSLGSSASARLWTYLILARLPSDLRPMAEICYCPLPTSMGTAGQHSSRWGHAPAPLPSTGSPHPGLSPGSSPSRCAPMPLPMTNMSESSQEAYF